MRQRLPPPLVTRLTLALLIVLSFPAWVVLAWHLAPRLLRLEQPAEALTRLNSYLVPVREPLVLSAVGFDGRPELLRRFLDAVGLHAADEIPATHPLLIPIEWVAAANPYTPLLAEYTDYSMSAVSLGYLGDDGRYHQVSFYLGEADTTPSWLVTKVRGSETRWGDYFVHYIVLLSSAIDGPPGRRQNSPQLDRVDWGSHAGGSYNGFEEIFIVSLVAPLGWLAGVVTFVLSAWYLDRRWRQARRAAQA